MQGGIQLLEYSMGGGERRTKFLPLYCPTVKPFQSYHFNFIGTLATYRVVAIKIALPN